jgi:hypothetical protein
MSFELSDKTTADTMIVKAAKKSSGTTALQQPASVLFGK